MNLSKQQIDDIQKYFRQPELSPVVKVELYGSYAAGTANSKSDIDLIIHIDYESLKLITPILAIKKELSELLKKNVSVITSRSLSRYIGGYLVNSSKLIYEKEKEIAFDQPLPTFNYKVTRDKAILQHLLDSSEFIGRLSQKSGWTEEDTKALIAELSIVKRSIQKLTNFTTEQFWTSSKTDMFSFPLAKFLDSLSSVTTYYGYDEILIRNFCSRDLRPFQETIEKLLRDWDKKFKASLVSHYSDLMISKLNSEIKQNYRYDSLKTTIGNQLTKTIDRLKIEELDETKIKEGEANIKFAASIINFGKIWDDFCEWLGPFFPLCP